MPLVTSAQMLKDAQNGGWAVGAFNIENMEMAQAVVAAAEQARAPVMIQTTPGTVRYATLALYHANVAALASAASVPVALHLDHGDSYKLATAALEAGYTSVMIDGSALSFEENIALSSHVVETAKGFDVPVEAELGRVGGKEDDTEGEDGGYTDPAEAAEFVQKSGISSLAVGIGTAHGIYVGTPKLDVERLSAIRRVVDIPLVLHGASGIADEDVQECIHRGICKVNYATELRIAYTNGVKQLLAEAPNTFDPKKYGAAGRDAVKLAVLNRMDVCGCTGRA